MSIKMSRGGFTLRQLLRVERTKVLANRRAINQFKIRKKFVGRIKM